jgi:hypothetical protein
VGAAVSATAVPVFYNINFTLDTGTITPTASFGYDASLATNRFSDFTFVFNGITFDLTTSANALSPGAPCNEGVGTLFAEMQSLTCGIDRRWQAFTGPGVVQTTKFIDTFGTTPEATTGLGTGAVVLPGINASNGQFTISAVPEPTTLLLTLAGGGLLAWRRRNQTAANGERTTQRAAG